MPIITPGIYMPNGLFLPNGGDGHRKNAIRFCQKFPELYQLKDSFSYLDADEFLIMGGCLIIAGYRGEKCIKVPYKDTNSFVQHLVEEYEKLNFKVYRCWELDEKFKNVLDTALNSMKKAEIILYKENKTNEFEK